MAVPNVNYDQLSAVTRRHFVADAADNIFDTVALANRWKKNSVYTSVDGGTKITQPLIYAQNGSGGWYAKADTLDTTDTDVITAAEYEWKFLYENITIFGGDEMKNSGMKAVLKYVQQKTDIAKMTIADRFGQSIYSDGSIANEIIGLQAMLSTSNTIGGISQSSNSWWQPQISADTVMTLSSLNKLYSDCSIGSNKPSVITSDSDEWDRYYDLLQPQQRFQDKNTADGGFTSLMFRGTPWIDDAAAPANKVFMLNEKSLKVWYHPKRNFTFKNFQDAINQDAKVGKILFMGAMGVSNGRMNGLASYTA